jgi:hypothetical protein
MAPNLLLSHQVYRPKVLPAAATNYHVRGLTTTLANSPPFACRGSTGHKPQCSLMMLAYQRFIALLVDQWLSLSEWRLLLSERVLVRRRKNVGV